MIYPSSIEPSWGDVAPLAIAYGATITVVAFQATLDAKASEANLWVNHLQGSTIFAACVALVYILVRIAFPDSAWALNLYYVIPAAPVRWVLHSSWVTMMRFPQWPTWKAINYLGVAQDPIDPAKLTGWRREAWIWGVPAQALDKRDDLPGRILWLLNRYTGISPIFVKAAFAVFSILTSTYLHYALFT